MLVLLNYVWADAMIEKERTKNVEVGYVLNAKTIWCSNIRGLCCGAPLLPDDGDWESNWNSWYAWCRNEHVNLNRNRLHTNYIVYERTCEPWWKTNYTQNVKAMDRNWNATCGWVGAPINLLFCMKACFRNCNHRVHCFVIPSTYSDDMCLESTAQHPLQ